MSLVPIILSGVDWCWKPEAVMSHCHENLGLLKYFKYCIFFPKCHIMSQRYWILVGALVVVINYQTEATQGQRNSLGLLAADVVHNDKGSSPWELGLCWWQVLRVVYSHLWRIWKQKSLDENRSFPFLLTKPLLKNLISTSNSTISSGKMCS